MIPERPTPLPQMVMTDCFSKPSSRPLRESALQSLRSAGCERTSGWNFTGGSLGGGQPLAWTGGGSTSSWSTCGTSNQTSWPGLLLPGLDFRRVSWLEVGVPPLTEGSPPPPQPRGCGLPGTGYWGGAGRCAYALKNFSNFCPKVSTMSFWVDFWRLSLSAQRLAPGRNGFGRATVQVGVCLAGCAPPLTGGSLLTPPPHLPLCQTPKAVLLPPG